MIQSRGQITVFIIIGISLIFIVGAALYISSSSERQRLELAKPRVSEIPERAQPVRDVVETCMNELLTDGLKRAGTSGGYVDDTTLRSNSFAPTEGDAVQLVQGGPKVAYWWHMKSKNQCGANCEFTSERPPLTKEDGSGSIEEQLERYIQTEIPNCLTSLQNIPGCRILDQGKPQATVQVADFSIIATMNHPVTISCEDQTYQVNDYALEIPLALREIYTLATNITNMQVESGILEQATNTILGTFSGIDSDRIPPSRGLEFGGPSQGTMWIKYDILQKIKGYLSSHIPLIQVFGTRNYNFIESPQNVRDPELYELVYNRQFLIPVDKPYNSIEARASYLDWWEPYFDLNCNGQLCRADSLNSFIMVPMSMHRYEFAYDISYPVLFELRDPYAFDGEGFVFNIMLEQNLRNSRRFKGGTVLPPPPATQTTPSIFCNPEQRTSGDVELSVLTAERKRPIDSAEVSYICGTNICNLGTVQNGTYKSSFPRCIGGTLLLTKAGYANSAVAIDTYSEEKQNIQVIMEPVRFLNATIRNYEIRKYEELDPWDYVTASGLVRPPQAQSAVILLQRQSLPGEEPFISVVELIGTKSAEVRLVPGKYTVQITSLYKDKLIIPSKPRCFTVKKVFSSSQECQNVPEKDIVFNESTAFPNGITEFEWLITTSELESAKQIEFRQFVLALDKVDEDIRRVEDLEHITDPQLFADSNPILVRPVIIV